MDKLIDELVRRGWKTRQSQVRGRKTRRSRTGSGKQQQKSRRGGTRYPSTVGGRGAGWAGRAGRGREGGMGGGLGSGTRDLDEKGVARGEE